MNESSPRFVTPTNTPLPRGSRLLTAYSPKLGRTVRAFDHATFEQWVRLEVDPGVVSFCEHPCRLGASDDGALIDFWVARPGQEEMLVVERGQGSAKLPKSIQHIPLRLVPAAEQSAAAVWVSNWLRMIPVINATCGTAPKDLIKCWDADSRHERPDQGRWVAAVKACGYVQARLAVRKEMAPATARSLEVA